MVRPAEQSQSPALPARGREDVGYSRKLVMQSASAPSAASASSPSARSVSMTPPLAPSASTERMLLASACRPLTATVTRERKPAAVFTNRPAGRACRDTSLGMSTPRSELAGTTYLLRRSEDFFERLAGRRDHCRRDRPFHERRVGQADAASVALVQDRADGQDGAAQVGQHDHASALLGPSYRALDQLPGRAEAALRVATRRLDSNLASCDLTSQSGQPSRQFSAVRHQYNPDQAAPSESELDVEV